MLTADLVRARRRGAELVIRPLSAAERERACELAATYAGILEGARGERRADVEEALAAVSVSGREKRLADGLRKLLEDRCRFEMAFEGDPAALRGQVYLAAAAARRAGTFDRAEVLVAAGQALGLPPEVVDGALHADLRGEQRLVESTPIGAEALVAAYEASQLQAALLRAVRVVAEVTCRSPDAYRALFRELKFRRLLHHISPREGGGYRIEIDGPYSLFDAVTRYGLALAMVLPALEACETLSLVADLRWGPDRAALTLRHERKGGGGASPEPPPRRTEVDELAADFAALGSGWEVADCAELLVLPGIGVTAPDLVFRHRGTGQRVFLEVLGYWSRDAVFRRVELAQRGLPEPIIFAVSSRLRVSEAVLDDDSSAALYVYKGVLSARAVERKLDELAARVATQGSAPGGRRRGGGRRPGG